MFKVKEICMIVMKYNIFISKLYLNFAGPEIEIIPSRMPSKLSTTGLCSPRLVLSGLHMCSEHANAF